MRILKRGNGDDVLRRDYRNLHSRDDGKMYSEEFTSPTYVKWNGQLNSVVNVSQFIG